MHSKSLLSLFGTYLYKILPLNAVLVTSNEMTLVTSPFYLSFSLRFLRYHVNTQYKVLSTVSGADFPEKRSRFEISYELLSIKFNGRARLKLFVKEFGFLQSAVAIFDNANWCEREIWDLFGVYFYSHPDLRRLLTDYGFSGFPLRKDFPLSGYVEVRFDMATNRIVCEPLMLSHEFRLFDFESPWRGKQSSNFQAYVSSK